MLSLHAWINIKNSYTHQRSEWTSYVHRMIKSSIPDNPLAVWSVSPELPLQKILILMYLLSKVDPLPAATDLRQQTVLFHDSQHSFRISVNISGLQPLPDPSVTISFICFTLAFLNLRCQVSIRFRSIQSFHKIIVATSGYLKKLTHDWYRILVPMTVDNCILYLRPHFLSANCRKSRSSLFSMRSRWIS